MVDRTPSLEKEKVYDRDAGDTIHSSDLHQLGKPLGSRVADVRNGAHHESAAEGRDIIVDSTDPDPLDLSRDQVHREEETMVVTRKVDPERGKSTINGENRILVEVVDPEPLTGEHGGRKSAGAKVPVRRSGSVNVTDAVTQSITDDVGMSGCRPSKGCSVCGGDNCKGTGSFCWDPGGVSAVNERY
jgi:hypothetical protein